MSETGQPGAATPGEHGDGTGPQDDLARTDSGWAPPTASWSRGRETSVPREPASSWGPPEPTPGWAAASARHGDLPPPLPGQPAGAEPPVSGPPSGTEPARLNGHRVNGVDHAGDGAPANRQAPVSAPPGLPGEQRRDPGNDRLMVPAQRPAPTAQQPPGPPQRFSDPEPGPARRSADDPPTGRHPHWSEPGLPTSAPPAVQVPPVGTAASGFEVPPGFRAPTAGRAGTEEGPSATGAARGWGDHFPPEPPAADPRPFPPAAGGPTATGERATDADRATGGDRAPRGAGPDQVGPGFGAGPDGERTPGGDPAANAERAAREPSPDPDPGGPRQSSAEWPPSTEPDWSGPNWNRPSWGAAWAPPWSREATEAPGRRSREEEPPGRRAREESAPEPVGRRSREEPPPAWAGEPHRPYEPVRPEAPRPHDPPRAPGHPYDVVQGPSAPRPAYEHPSAASPGPEAERQPPAGQPAWTAGGTVAAPASAPPLAYAPEAAAPPRAEDTPDRATRPFRLRPENAEPAPRSADGPQGAPGPVAEAGTGFGRREHTPSVSAPASAPPYTARRSAPEPDRAAQPGPGDPTPDPTAAVLPQRVPAEPDVPVVPEPPAVDPPAETPELARIATHLRRDDEPAPPRERPEGFDVNAILDAVRGVAGVRDAALRRTPAGAHSLRLDLSDGADPAEVSRQVARLLQDRMGLAAAPQNVPGMPSAPAPPVRRRAAPRAADSRSPVAPARPAEPRVPGGPPEASPVRAEQRPETPPTGTGRPEASPRGTGRSEASPAGTGRPEVVPARAEQRAEVAPARAEQRAEVASPRAEQRAEGSPETPRRRRQPAVAHRGRATVEEPGSVSTAPGGASVGALATVGTSYSGGQVTTTETAPPRPLDTGGTVGPRVVIDHVQVSTFGLDANVEVRLLAGAESAAGYSTGPAVDGYVLRLCAVAAAAAVDELLRGGENGPDAGPDRGRCFVEHAAVVPFGNCDVATVVVLLVCDGWVEQLVGSALVAGDPRQAVVRATLAAVNRRLEALLA